MVSIAEYEPRTARSPALVPPDRECNSACGCDSSCINRVGYVEQPLRVMTDSVSSQRSSAKCLRHLWASCIALLLA